MCCAPSNAACDEIIRRLRQGIPSYHGKKRFVPSIVRLGSAYSVHQDVKDVTLEFLVEEKFLQAPELQHLMKSKDLASAKEKELRGIIDALTKERDLLGKQLVEAGTGETVEEISAKLRDVNDKRRDALKSLFEEKEKKSDSRNSLDNVKLQARKSILSDADVVCCTLSSAGHDTLLNANLEFPVVVIDEACQSIELSALIPLKFNAKKCILVGGGSCC